MRSSRLTWTVLASAGLTLSVIPLHAQRTDPPPITFSVQPEEDNRLVYLPIAPVTADASASGLFGLRLTIANNDADPVRLTAIQVMFTYGDNAVQAFMFKRDLTIDGASQLVEYLTPDESIQLSAIAPVRARIDLFCEGFGQPRTLERSLVAYQAPTPDGKYLFPYHGDDLAPNSYLSHIVRHTGGSQFFGYDFHAQTWDENNRRFTSRWPGTDASLNESSVIWDLPLYSMAEGIVLRSSGGWADNPSAGTRVIQRMGEAEAGAITDVRVTRLASDRAATLARRSSGALELTVWDLNDFGRQVLQRGSVTAEAVDQLAMDALDGTRLATAVRLPSGAFRLIAWDVSTDGMTLARRGSVDAIQVDEVSLAKVSGSQVATALRTASGNLQLILWEVSTDGSSWSLLSQVAAGEASSVSVMALSDTRLVTVLRNSQERLQAIVWEILDNGATLERRGGASADHVTQVDAARSSGSQFDTAARTLSGNLQLLRWNVSSDGQGVSQILEADAGAIQKVAVIPNFDSTAITAVVTGDGAYKSILWQPPDDSDPPGQFQRWGEANAGNTDVVHLDLVDTAVHLAAVRTASGNLKVIAWYVGSGGGNNFVILHGNARVLYAHLRDGTMNPDISFPGARVAAGQYLGRVGNSGSSAGPHTHIHAERVPPFLTPEQLIQQEAAGSVTLLGFRPIPFHCGQAMLLTSIQPGAANPFSELNGEGIYFAQYGIRPTWLQECYVDGATDCTLPSGRKDCLQVGPLGFNGPFPKVNQALVEPCWTDKLFIRGGAYPESVIFDRRMIVRSYDGVAVIGE
jgi:hypothetical protein